MVFGFLERCLAILMKFCQALIASICQKAQMAREFTGILFAQLKVMFASITKGGGYDLGTFSISHHLRFLGMTLLFATVVPVFSFGHSTSCSLTSTSTTSNTVSLAGRVSSCQANGGFTDTIGLRYMKFGSILSPIPQGHQQLIGAAQPGWSAKVSQPCFDDRKHLLKGCMLDTC